MMHTPPRARASGPWLNRRGFLAGIASTTLLAACSSTEGSTDVEPSVEFDDGALWLQAGFSDGLRAPATMAAGRPERGPFVFVGADGLPVVNGLPDQIELVVLAPDGSTSSVVSPRRDVGIPTPYYPLEFTPTISGDYAVNVEIGGETQRVDFRVAEPEDVGLIVPGEQLRPVDTPTFDDARGFDPICTRFDPCPFHEINLADAITNGRPTALLIATPGFCQTAICGPVIELLLDQDPSAEMNVIHAEVWEEPARINEIGYDPQLLGPITLAYDMIFEPSLVVANAAGTVTARLDYAWDADEQATALRTATA